jgi:3-hydroxybutyryl-CoA dehydrogenase
MAVQAVAVLGARNLGREIARAAALGGYRTILEDMSAAMLEQAMVWIRESMEGRVARDELTPQECTAALRRITTARTVEDACREADLVIEAFPEDEELQIEVFTLLDRFGRPGAIYASTTSSLSIQEMAAMTACAERCVGLRFSSSAPEAKSLEIVRAPATSDATVEACREVARRMGRAVVVRDEVCVTQQAGKRGGKAVRML